MRRRRHDARPAGPSWCPPAGELGRSCSSSGWSAARATRSTSACSRSSPGRLDVHHILAATVAFCVAVTNNFAWNRHWTFAPTDGHAGFQAARFFAVSCRLAINLILLGAASLSAPALPALAAQALAVGAATPLNFLGNKLWSFARGGPARLVPIALAPPSRSDCSLAAVAPRAATAARRRHDPTTADQPPSCPTRPRTSTISAAPGARDRAASDAKVAEELRSTLRPPDDGDRRATTPACWQVSYFDRRHEEVQVQVDPTTGATTEAWTGYQVRGGWRAATPAPSARLQRDLRLAAARPDLPDPFIDFRRPFRLLHLDLLVLLAFGSRTSSSARRTSACRCRSSTRVLGYLLVRMLWRASAGRRAGPRARRCRPGARPRRARSWWASAWASTWPTRTSIDVGYAGVTGADYITHGQPIYGEGDVPRGQPLR